MKTLLELESRNNEAGNLVCYLSEENSKTNGQFSEEIDSDDCSDIEISELEPHQDKISSLSENVSRKEHQECHLYESSMVSSTLTLTRVAVVRAAFYPYIILSRSV